MCVDTHMCAYTHVSRSTGVTEKLKEIEERMAEVKDKVDGINAKDALMTHANNLIDSVQKKLINLQVCLCL